MNIWIVEYGCVDFCDQEGFNAAFTTHEKALAYAEKVAHEAADNDAGVEYVIEVSIDETQVSVRNVDNDAPSDWWNIREVPLE